MKKVIKKLTMLGAIILLLIGGCKKDEIPNRSTTYQLIVEDVLGVTGTVTFIELKNSTTTIDIMLNNAPTGTYPASLCEKSAVEKGAAIITLNPVDETGKSSTNVTSLSYGQLIAYDGCIKVLQSSDPELIIALGDIGGNVLTLAKKMYTLNLIGVYSVSGTALFEQRVNENTLVTISLTGTIAGELFPATINLGSIASVGGGPVVKTLNDVDGSSGNSYTNIRKLDSGIDITYDNWLVYDGYINVYQTSVNLNNIISQGNIGSN
jgi:hypothetical protein